MALYTFILCFLCISATVVPTKSATHATATTASKPTEAPRTTASVITNSIRKALTKVSVPAVVEAVQRTIAEETDALPTAADFRLEELAFATDDMAFPDYFDNVLVPMMEQMNPASMTSSNWATSQELLAWVLKNGRKVPDNFVAIEAMLHQKRHKWIQDNFADLKNRPVRGWGAMVPVSNAVDAPWETTMTGPRGTPYAGQLFTITLSVPLQHLVKAPRISSATPIYHCNVAHNGYNACDLSIMKRWKTLNDREKSVRSVLEEFYDAMIEPQCSQKPRDCDRDTNMLWFLDRNAHARHARTGGPKY